MVSVKSFSCCSCGAETKTGTLAWHSRCFITCHFAKAPKLALFIEDTCSNKIPLQVARGGVYKVSTELPNRHSGLNTSNY